MSKRHRWSDEEKLYLKEIVLDRSYKEIASLMKDKFNYNFEVMQISCLHLYHIFHFLDFHYLHVL